MKCVSTAVVCTIALGVPFAASAQPPVRVPEMKTPLHGLALGESLLVRVAETRAGVPPFEASVRFFTERNVPLRTITRTVAPGMPATFELRRSELPAGPHPAVRAVIEISPEASGTPSETMVGYEFLIGNDPTPRSGGYCVTQLSGTAPGGGPRLVCVGSLQAPSSRTDCPPEGGE